MERRASFRSRLNRQVAGRIPATPVSVTILDLSATGCRVRAPASALPRGRTILLNLSDDEEVAGSIVWQDGEEAGVQFLQALSADTLSRQFTSAAQPIDSDSLKDHLGRPLPPLDAKLRFI